MVAALKTAGNNRNETTARQLYENDLKDWETKLLDLIRQIDSVLITKYDVVSPFKNGRGWQVDKIFCAWDPQMPGAIAGLQERVALLREDDVPELARKYKVDLTAATNRTFKTLNEARGAYAQHVGEYRKKYGRAPSWAEDWTNHDSWGRRNGLTQRKVRLIRKECKDRSESDKRAGLRNGQARRSTWGE